MVPVPKGVPYFSAHAISDKGRLRSFLGNFLEGQPMVIIAAVDMSSGILSSSLIWGST